MAPPIRAADRTYRRLAWTAGAVAGLALAGTHAAAQQPVPLPGVVLGRVVAAEGGQPVPLALVSFPGLGRRMFASTDGSFLLSGIPAGVHTLRIEQLGRATVDTLITLPLSPDERARGMEVRMVARPIPLEALAVSPPGACLSPAYTSLADAEPVARVIDEFRKNADRYGLLLDQYPLRIELEVTRRDVAENGRVLRETRDTVQVQSESGRWLYRPGTVLEESVDAQGQRRLRMSIPSVYAFGQDAFQRHHCFRYAGVSEVGGRPHHRIDFQPTADVVGPDVEGSLYLDTDSYLLRASELRLTGVAPDAATGSVAVWAEYTEIHPQLTIVGRFELSQRPQGMRVDGRAVARRVETQRLVAHHFGDAIPGVQPSPVAGETHTSDEENVR